MERLAMTRNGSIWMLTAALALSGLATPARAQQVSESRIRELITQAADRAASGNLATDAQPPAASAAGQRRIVRLTLDDAVRFALDRNLDIAVQRLNPEINDLALARIRAVYHPSLTSTLATPSLSTRKSIVSQSIPSSVDAFRYTSDAPFRVSSHVTKT